MIVGTEGQSQGNPQPVTSSELPGTRQSRRKKRSSGRSSCCSRYTPIERMRSCIPEVCALLPEYEETCWSPRRARAGRRPVHGASPACARPALSARCQGHGADGERHASHRRGRGRSGSPKCQASLSRKRLADLEHRLEPAGREGQVTCQAHRAEKDDGTPPSSPDRRSRRPPRTADQTRHSDAALQRRGIPVEGRGFAGLGARLPPLDVHPQSLACAGISGLCPTGRRLVLCIRASWRMHMTRQYRAAGGRAGNAAGKRPSRLLDAGRAGGDGPGSRRSRGSVWSRQSNATSSSCSGR